MNLNDKEKFDNLYSQEDPWKSKSLYAEQVRLKNTFELISKKHYHCILELGCGEGAFTSKLINIGDKIYAVDIAEMAINKAKNRYGERVNFSLQDIRDLKFEPETFDLICTIEVIYYPLPTERGKIIDNLYNLLKKNGDIIFSAPILPGYFKYDEFIDLISRKFKILNIEPVTTNLFKLGSIIKRIPLLSKTGIYELAMILTRKFPKQIARHLAILATRV
ncbi:MAG: class I SAM-dependent methyltransferase [bacterium]|nr:class I SAM-dependent methyltransferase [bacterium]